MKTRAFLAAGLLTLAVSAARAQGYYPATPGYSWTYSSGETQSISGPREVSGRSLMILTHYLEGMPVSEDYVEFGPQGVLAYGYAANGQLQPYDPPIVIYPPEPLTPGTKWTSTTMLPAFSMTLDAEVVGLRGVATPTGRYNALLIRQTTLTSNGGQTLLDVYFVPSVGIVRFVTQDGTVIDLIDKNF